MISKVVILLAGYGTRCLPFTKCLPKAMVPILNKPVIHYIVEEIEKSNLKEIIFVLPKNCNGKIVKQYFTPKKSYEKFLTERKKYDSLVSLMNIKTKLKRKFIFTSKANGSGGALLNAKRFLKDEDFAVFNGDDLFLGQIMPITEMIKIYEKTNKSVLGLGKVAKSEKSLYGIVEFDMSKIVKKFFEKPKSNVTKSNYASLGRYIFKNDILEELKKAKKHLNGEIYLTDPVETLIQKKQVVCQILSAKRFDCGCEDGILKASIYMSAIKGKKQEIKTFIDTIK